MTELQYMIIQNQEQRLQEIWSKFMLIASKLLADMTSVRESLDFAHIDLAQLKSSASAQSVAELTETEKRCDTIQASVTRLSTQVDYLDNQSRRNNLRVAVSESFL